MSGRFVGGTGRAVQRLLVCGVLAGAVALSTGLGGTGRASAQSPASAPVVNNPYYAAPGNYGTSFGSASYRMPRLYSEFSSPSGGGFGYGYAPARVLPGRYGIGLWRPTMVEGGYVYGAPDSYRTFAVPYVRGGSPTTAGLPPAPPFGAYAPSFGPGFAGW